jgi:peroxiredoxin
MSLPRPLSPRQPVPELELPLAGGGRWRLSEQQPEHFTLIVVYRGLHCPICSGYLRDLNRKLPKFAGLGVDVIAVTNDPEDRAERAKAEWDVDDLSIGYDLDLNVARDWGLYISSGRGMTSAGVEETPYFVEPGLFLVRTDGTLYFASVQTMPFARPNFSEVLQALDFVLNNDYPARGEVIDFPN